MNNRGMRDGPILPVAILDTYGTNTISVERKPMLQFSASQNTSGDQTLIAAPGSGKQIVITFIQLQNESNTASTALLKFGSTTKYRILGQTQGDGSQISFARGLEWGVGDNNALVLNLSAAVAWGATIGYYIETIG